MMKRILRRMFFWWALWACVVAGLVAFGTHKPPPVLGVITDAFAAIDTGSLPPLQRYPARDGAQLAFRLYPGGQAHLDPPAAMPVATQAPSQVAVLIHGSAGSSVDMHPLAQALRAAGITVLVPDLRGHGANAPHGDVAYVGQLGDDLADLVASRKSAFPGAAWTLLGFSSGGGFVLRIAADPRLGGMFDRYILVSPYLKYNAPSVRRDEPPRPAGQGAIKPAASGPWAVPFMGRIIGLNILDTVGIHAWDGLPVIAFAVPSDVPSVTSAYSWRLLQDFGARPDYLADIRALSRPTRVFVGADDLLLDADKLKAEFQAQRTDVAVSIISGTGHSDMITGTDAIGVIAAEFIGQAAPRAPAPGLPGTTEVSRPLP